MVDGTDNAATLNLDTTLDDIDDLPSFICPLSGGYTFKTSWEQKDIGDHKGAISIGFEVIEVHDLSEEPDEGEQAPKVGDKFNIPYMSDNKFGVGMLKQDILLPVAKHFNMMGNTKSEILNQLNGATVICIIKRTFSKKSEKYFPKIKKLSFV